jgi:NAD(P)-dependent dehydrogenase (short-subunit alcohol dehydrogenase family)/acyl carrier protein
VRLPVSAAFHSNLVKDAQQPFSRALKTIDIQESDIPVFSNITGKPYPAEPENAKQLLADHLLSPVDFVGEINRLYTMGVRTFVEVGPKSVLTGLVKSILKGQHFKAVSIDSTLGQPSGIADLAKTLSFLASLGHSLDLSAWEPEVKDAKKQRMSILLSGTNYRNRSSEVRGRKSEAEPAAVGGLKLEAGASQLEVGGWRLEAGKRFLPQTSSEAILKPNAAEGAGQKSEVGGPVFALRATPGKQRLASGSYEPMAWRAVGSKAFNQQFLQRTGGSFTTITNHKSKSDTFNHPSTINNQQSKNTMKTKHPQNNVIPDALQVLQEGLKSMQALQKQTAETHQKFLETQTQAAKTLQHMMENTQRLVEGSLGIQTHRITSHDLIEGHKEELASTQKVSTGLIRAHTDPQPSVEESMGHSVSGESLGPIPSDAPAEKAVVETPDPEANGPAPADKNQDKDQKEIENLLLATVSQLTGYPVEMLAPDMDIEADLGIDSIKRVEILSALEEKMPELPAVSPDVMGTLKTLDQIVCYLSDTTGDAAASSEPQTMEPSAAGHREIENILLETVSRLTGYPVEMLAPDMDIEADLGIDSIKRVEILSALEEKMPELPAVSPDVMGTLKTMSQIVCYLAGTPAAQLPEPEISVSASDSQPTPIRESLAPSPRHISDFSPETLAAGIGRKAVTAVEKPLVRTERLSMPHERAVYITDDKTGLSQAIVDGFKSQNIRAKILSDKRICAVISGKNPIKNAAGLVITAQQPADDGFLKQAFSLAKSLGPDLLDSAEQGGALFASVTRLDGAFGFKGWGIDHPVQGGLAGLVKTAAVEWENVRCRAFDIAPLWQNHADIARTLVSELLYADPSCPVEVGLDSDARWIPELESLPFPQGEINLHPKDVVVVTGGARGVTAAAACALAEYVKPTLVLLGRSLPPAPEPEWLKGIQDPAAVKKAIFDNEFGGSTPTPVQLEKNYKKVMAHREIAKNLETMKSFGADVHYYSVDVRNAGAVNAIFNDVRNTMGPIKGIIHGAGLLADCRIVDKSVEQFETVYSTKVNGLRTLLSATKKDPLNYLVLFSSVTARVGNNGQADYAMANEVLNKMAQKESVQRPDCRVISINWGPWDGGMVCSALKRKFKNSGVNLIPVDAGAMCMIHELKGDKSSPVEVVIGANILSEKEVAETLESALKPPIVLNQKETLFVTVQREIDVDRYPILGAHILDGKPVVPFALIAEWLGHGALHENPGLLLHGLDDMRIFHGIKLDQKKKHIRLMAGKARKKGAAFEVDVQIRDGIKDNIEVIHSGATAILTDRLEPPPAFDLSAYIGTNGYSKTIDEIYEKILFHRVELQGIREIIGYSAQSITARISSAPSPAAWMTEPLRSQWIADPLVLDSACQMAILWCFEQRGMVSLPSYSASYRQYRDVFPSNGVTAVLEIKETGDHKIKGDFTFLDAHEKVVARMTGYEAVMDESLSKAFKRKHAE